MAHNISAAGHDEMRLILSLHDSFLERGKTPMGTTITLQQKCISSIQILVYIVVVCISMYSSKMHFFISLLELLVAAHKHVVVHQLVVAHQHVAVRLPVVVRLCVVEHLLVVGVHHPSWEA